MRKLLLALAAATLLGGCVKSSAPKDLPSYVTVYPGATNVMSMGVGPMSAIVFQAAAGPDEVVNYYRGQATSSGLQETAITVSGPADQRQARFQDLATKRILVVAARPGGAGSIVSLSYSKG